MGATLDEIYAEALALPANTRMELVVRLLGSMRLVEEGARELLPEDPGLTQEGEGAVPMISGEDVFRQIRDSLAARSQTPSAGVPG